MAELLESTMLICFGLSWPMNLENDLGVPLFVPKGRNIMLTEYGKYLQKKLILANESYQEHQSEISQKHESPVYPVDHLRIHRWNLCKNL